MNRHVNAVSGRLSLRKPQRDSLEALAEVMELARPEKRSDLRAALDVIRSEYPSVTDFEREFPSLCFALATGVGKTRLMGAFVAYLHLAHGIDNFFILAPGLTVYRKLVEDFTPNTPKYVFEGIGEFAVYPPEVITGDDYESRGHLLNDLSRVKINIFNAGKITGEVRGGKAPRMKRMSEYLGQSYFDYLSKLPDLVLLMDESHRYRASAGVRAINELRPILGLELTATPFVETSRGTVPFKNVIVDYPLSRAIEDGFVKEPAVVTRKNFVFTGNNEALEDTKLRDGVRLHEQVKSELATFALNTGEQRVKPFVLVIARDTTHAAQLVKKIEDEEFLGGNYVGRVMQVDSSKSGAEEDEMIAKILTVESSDNPIEIVVHVNMLKEGWDVTNLYTIIPLRAANARVLIEQSIGRGLRLPYGKRTGVDAVDRLNIISHDKFQEIIDEANRPDSAIRLKTLVMSEEDLLRGTKPIISESNIAIQLGIAKPSGLSSQPVQAPLFKVPEAQKAAQATYQVLQRLQTQPHLAPTTAALRRPEVQAMVVREVQKQLSYGQTTLEGTTPDIDLASIVAETTSLVQQQTIDIPRILVTPKMADGHEGGFKPFKLDLNWLRYPVPDNELWVQHLRTKKTETIGLLQLGRKEQRPEDYIVSALITFEDIAYDHQAELLYDLAGQVVEHLTSYLSDDDAERVLSVYADDIGRNVHLQMLQHYDDEPISHDVTVRRGWTPLRPSGYTIGREEQLRDFRETPPDKGKIGQYLYGMFEHCLYPLQKFHSDSERLLAVIVDRAANKWFRPVKGQFQIFYHMQHEVSEYQPDFVAETSDRIYMIECKARKDLEATDVLAKKRAGEEWCRRASDYNREQGGKPWKYLLIPHDRVSSNLSLSALEQISGAQ